jgi:hypothetical protein
MDLDLYRPYRARFHALQEEYEKLKSKGDEAKKKERRLRCEIEVTRCEAKWRQEAEWKAAERKLKARLAVEQKKLVMSELESNRKNAEISDLVVGSGLHGHVTPAHIVR